MPEARWQHPVGGVVSSQRTYDQSFIHQTFSKHLLFWGPVLGLGHSCEQGPVPAHLVLVAQWARVTGSFAAGRWCSEGGRGRVGAQGQALIRRRVGIAGRQTCTPKAEPGSGQMVLAVSAEELRGMWQEQSGRLPGRSGIELGLKDGEGLDEGGTCRPRPR